MEDRMVCKMENMFRKALDRVTDSIMAVYMDGRLLYVNDHFIAIHGLDNDWKKYTVFDLPISLNTPELFAQRAQCIRQARGNYTYIIDYHNVQTDSAGILQVSAFVMKDDEGEECLWLFGKDITELMRSHDELNEKNRLLSAIMDNVPVSLFVKDTGDNFKYLYWNKGFVKISHIPESAALGHTDFEIFPDKEDAEKFRRDDLEVLRTGQRLETQESYLAANGETRIVETVKALIPLKGRSPLIIGVSLDITSFEAIEEELIRARIKAEESDRLKTAFLANMSHEIRTPLNAIVGFSRLMGTAPSPEEEKMYSDIINQNSEILLQLINDILDLAKIEAGTLEFVKVPVELGELFRNVYEIHKSHLQPGVELVLDEIPTPITIHEDRNRLMQVLTNLINNASKFTSDGSIHIGYTLADGYLRFYVKDTGIGISEEKQKEVFGRFVKLNTFVQGTGLGLSICKMIVERIGGKIGVNSSPGEGSEFYFTIPYDDSLN